MKSGEEMVDVVWVLHFLIVVDVCFHQSITQLLHWTHPHHFFFQYLTNLLNNWEAAKSILHIVHKDRDFLPMFLFKLRFNCNKKFGVFEIMRKWAPFYL